MVISLMPSTMLKFCFSFSFFCNFRQNKFSERTSYLLSSFVIKCSVFLSEEPRKKVTAWWPLKYERNPQFFFLNFFIVNSLFVFACIPCKLSGKSQRGYESSCWRCPYLQNRWRGFHCFFFFLTWLYNSDSWIFLWT
jgi:hypothetical protein